ncbi:MAG: DUF3524 domain-containing protein [Acidimicrobiales bacterium]|nr:DUF3524 domain-containing protein [Acidimicrobiales bacterium]
MTMRIDLVEPFLGGSHEAWARGWAVRSRHDVDLFGLAANAWRWRMRGASTTLAASVDERAAVEGPPALLVASDMVDLGDLLGRLRRTHHAVPAVLYLHENQLTYPRQPGEPLDPGLAWTTWRNLTVADEIWCNSAFHRDELLAALPPFLAAVPDGDHLHLLSAVTAKMRVLPVGVDLPPENPGPRATPPLVVSNQRWHHDKDVDAVVRALGQLARDGLDFRVAVLGDGHGGHADRIDPLLDELGDRVVARGHQPRTEYLRLLADAEIVVSAARNEFFGIAVIEAVAAGATPVLPSAVAYPETMPAWAHPVALYEPGTLRAALRTAIVDAPARRRAVAGLSAEMAPFGWDVLARIYDDAAERVAATVEG